MRFDGAMSNQVRFGPAATAWALCLLAAVAVALPSPAAAFAPSTPLDPSFGNGGFVVTRAADGVVTSLAEDHQGRLVAAGIGARGLLLARYLTDGSLDPSFGHVGTGPDRGRTSGIVSTGPPETGAFGMAIQPDGKILTAGPESLMRGYGIGGAFVVVRHLPDGRPDPSFGRENGRVATRLGLDAGGARALALQDDGRIVVGGFEEGLAHRATAMLIRYLPDGEIDRSFGFDGIRYLARGNAEVTGVGDVQTLPDGEMLVAGSAGADLYIAKLRSDGRPDRRFGGGDGRVVASLSRRRICDACPDKQSLALAPNGDIVLAASVSGHSGVFRFDSSGGRDRSFGDNGLVRLRRITFFGAARDVLLTRGSRILVVGGTEYASAVFRLLPDGRRDPSFAEGGKMIRHTAAFSQLCAGLLLPDGEVIVAGRADTGSENQEADFFLETAGFLLMKLRR